MEWDEKWPFLPKDFDGKGNCQEKLPYPEGQPIGCLYCRQEALFQPFTAKLAVKGLDIWCYNRPRDSTGSGRAWTFQKTSAIMVEVIDWGEIFNSATHYC